MKLQENSVFANRYELQKLLGRGGFSEVWLAKDQWTHLDVAIKVYAPGQGMEEDGMKEFCGELAQVYDINHSNLLQPKHVDNWENMPYLIMAYCPNGSCSKLIGKATEEQMWRIIHDVASGLAYLHEKGVVHQDIKPANILIDEDGDYLITDFGVSSRARSTLRKSVVSSTGGGTTAYMGPERFSSQPAPTKASDIWSFGAMCFELVEGDVPFGELGGGFQKSGAEIPMINAKVSDALKFVIAKMLQKETWDRPTAATLMEWAASPQCIKIENTPPIDRPTERRNNAPVAEPEVRETARQNAPVSKNEKDIPAKKVKSMMWGVVGVVAILIGVVCLLVFGNTGKEDDGGEEPIIAEAVVDTMPVRDTVVDVKTDTATVAKKEEVKKERLENDSVIKPKTKMQSEKAGVKDKPKQEKVSSYRYAEKKYSNGDYYIGEWKDDKKNGQGTYTFADGRKYVGEWKDDKKNGRGTFTWPDGEKYVGEFKDGLRNGQGTDMYANGNKYVGEFKDGKRNGQGTYTFADGRKYVGEWKDGKENGQGTFTWPNGEKYVGEFKDEKMNGQGTYTWPDGEKYVGEYKDGLRNGQGTDMYANGNKYVGEFKDDKRNGQGTMYYNDGSIKTGYWKNGKYVGQ